MLPRVNQAIEQSDRTRRNRPLNRCRDNQMNAHALNGRVKARFGDQWRLVTYPSAQA